MECESIVVILAVAGGTLGCDALDGFEGIVVTWVRVEREGDVACLAARVRHADPTAEFRVRFRQWGMARGWAVTVAPCSTPR